MKVEIIKESSAGCLVPRKRKGQVEVLLIRKHLFNDLRLPKGRIEYLETPQQAAVREVLEETGYLVDIFSHVPLQITVTLTKKLPYVHKTIYFYPASVVSGHPENRIEKKEVSGVEWLPIETAVALIEPKE